MGALRFVFPLVFPIWILVFPAACYLNEAGRVFPSEEIRTFVYESSGPWSHDVCIVFILSLMAGIAVHAIALIYMFATWRKEETLIWFLGSALGVCTTIVSLYFFGNLMDI